MHKHKLVNLDKGVEQNAYHLLRASLNKFGKTPEELSEPELEAAWQQAKKGYEIERLVLSSKEAQGVILPKSSISKSLEAVKERYESEEDFFTDLEKNGLDEKKLYDALYRELLVETVLETVASKAADVSDMDVMIYYYLHKDKFTKPETREAYHILITINDEFEENQRNAAYSRLNDIRKRVIKKPSRFGEQALKHSECPTAMREGFLGNIPKGELYPELEQILFNMKEGEISEVVESPVGFHILFCKSIDAAGPVSLEQAEPKIREHLQQKRRRICQKNWLNGLTKQGQSK